MGRSATRSGMTFGVESTSTTRTLWLSGAIWIPATNAESLRLERTRITLCERRTCVTPDGKSRRATSLPSLSANPIRLRWAGSRSNLVTSESVFRIRLKLGQGKGDKLGVALDLDFHRRLPPLLA